MKKYQYLKLKYIIPTILFILIVVFLSIYLFGGLKKKTITFTNDSFDSTLEGYIDYAEYEKLITDGVSSQDTNSNSKNSKNGKKSK